MRSISSSVIGMLWRSSQWITLDLPLMGPMSMDCSCPNSGRGRRNRRSWLAPRRSSSGFDYGGGVNAGGGAEGVGADDRIIRGDGDAVARETDWQ